MTAASLQPATILAVLETDWIELAKRQLPSPEQDSSSDHHKTRRASWTTASRTLLDNLTPGEFVGWIDVQVAE